MYDYIKPTQRHLKPEIFVLHVATNDLRLSKSPKKISEDIVTLVESMKTDNNKIIVSSVVCRKNKFREKVDKVNAHLEEICAEKDIAIITHSNINPKRHLSTSRLHLNDAVISVLVRNFKAFLTNLDLQEYEDSVRGNSPFVIGDSVFSNDISRMKKQRLDNASNTIIGHLNINLFRNKFIFVKDIIKLFDVFLVSESKLDRTFPSNQLRINGYKLFRLDRNRFGGGLILYINENIPCKPLQEHIHLPKFEVIAIEFYQNNQKWLLLGLYKPPNQKTSDFIQNLSLVLDLFLKNYDNVTLIGDFNLSSDDVPFESFLQAYNLTSLIKEATCFQSSNPSCIDLILTNQKISINSLILLKLGYLITTN